MPLYGSPELQQTPSPSSSPLSLTSSPRRNRPTPIQIKPYRFRTRSIVENVDPDPSPTSTHHPDAKLIPIMMTPGRAGIRRPSTNVPVDAGPEWPTISAVNSMSSGLIAHLQESDSDPLQLVHQPRGPEEEFKLEERLSQPRVSTELARMVSNGSSSTHPSIRTPEERGSIYDNQMSASMSTDTFGKSRLGEHRNWRYHDQGEAEKAGRSPEQIQPMKSGSPRRAGFPVVRSTLIGLGIHSSSSPMPRERSVTEDSSFTISAYADLPPNTPNPPRAEDIKTGDIYDLYPASGSLPTAKSSVPQHGSQGTGGESSEGAQFVTVGSSATTEGGFFRSQMDDYLAHRLDHRIKKQNSGLTSSSNNFERSGSGRSAASYGSERSGGMLSIPPSSAPHTAPQMGAGAGDRTTAKSGRSPLGMHSRQKSGDSMHSNKSLMRPIDQETTIQLTIDQESFRKVQPVFQYSRTRFIKQRRNQGGRPHTADAFVDLNKKVGWIEFRMQKKEFWPFHYSAVEALPVLKHISVNGDDRYDYLKRNATMNLKTNGVYEVKDINDEGDVEWRFEYVVEDKKSEGSGKAITGEKIIMPLSFMCSPDFLDRSKAHRSGFINKVRKSVAPNVNAHRIPPPSREMDTSKLPYKDFKSLGPITSPESNDENWAQHNRTGSLGGRKAKQMLQFGSWSRGSKGNRRPATADPSFPQSAPPLPPLNSFKQDVATPLNAPKRPDILAFRSKPSKSQLGSSDRPSTSHYKQIEPVEGESSGNQIKSKLRPILKRRPATANPH